MSTDQSFIKKLNNLGKSFKDNVEDIDQNAKDMEERIDSLLNSGMDISEMPAIKEMKDALDGFLDNFDLEDIFTKVILEKQLEDVFNDNIKPELAKFGIDLDNFNPDPSSILSAFPNLIPKKIKEDFPNLKSQIQEIVDMVSSEDLRVSFNRVTEEVPERSKDDNSDKLPQEDVGQVQPKKREKETGFPLGNEMEKFIKEIFQNEANYFEETIERLESIVMGSGIFLELEEEMETLIEKIKSGRFSDSNFQKEFFGDVADLIKDLANGALALIRDLIDFLFDEIAKIFGLIQDAFYKAPRKLTEENQLKTPNDLISSIIQTIIPQKSVSTLLTFPSLVVSTPYTLVPKLFNSPTPSQEEGIFSSTTGYGGVQLGKGGLALINAMNIGVNSSKKDWISWILSLLDIGANVFAQILSTPEPPSEKLKEEGGDKYRYANFNYIIWAYQWGLTVGWPFVVAGFESFYMTKILKKGKEGFENIKLGFNLASELTHLGLFSAIIHHSSSNPNDDNFMDPRTIAASIIDPMPGIIGGGISIYTTVLGRLKLKVEDILELINRVFDNLKATLDKAGNSANLRNTFKEFEDNKKEIINYLNENVENPLLQIEELFNTHIIFSNEEFKENLPHLLIASEVALEKIRDAKNELNTVKGNEFLNKDRTNWTLIFDDIVKRINDLESSLIEKTAIEIENEIKVIKARLKNFKNEKKATSIIFKLKKPLTNLRTQLQDIYRLTVSGFLDHLEDFKKDGPSKVENDWLDFNDQLNEKKEMLERSLKIFNRNEIVDNPINKVVILEEELNKLNVHLSTIIKLLTDLLAARKRGDTHNSKIDKEIKWLEIGSNIFTFLCQSAYGTLIWNELPPVICELPDKESYKVNETKDITISLFITPSGWLIEPPILKIQIDNETEENGDPKLLEIIESSGVEKVNKYPFKFTIPPKGSLVSITVVKGGKKVEDSRLNDWPQRVHKSFIINNPQNMVFPRGETVGLGKEVTINTLNDPNETNFQNWFAPEGTTVFIKDAEKMSSIEGKAKDLTKIAAPIIPGEYRLFVKDANGFISPPSTAILTVTKEDS